MGVKRCGQAQTSRDQSDQDRHTRAYEVSGSVRQTSHWSGFQNQSVTLTVAVNHRRERETSNRDCSSFVCCFFFLFSTFTFFSSLRILQMAETRKLNCCLFLFWDALCVITGWTALATIIPSTPEALSRVHASVCMREEEMREADRGWICMSDIIRIINVLLCSLPVRSVQ